MNAGASKHGVAAWRERRTVVVGMCHCPALPGAPRYAGDWRALVEHVLRDAGALREGGAHGIMLENFGDVPFYPDRVPASVVACMATIAARVRDAVELPLGINVLRNDGRSALAIASAVGADFIRVNVLSHARLTDQGVIQAIAHDVLRDRAALRAESIQIFADVDAKESVPLAAGLSLEDEVDDVVRRGLADAVVISGANTGGAASAGHVARAAAAARGVPVFVGSGVTAQNVGDYLPHCDGVIVGTAFKPGGDPRAAIDPARVRELVRRVGD